MNGRCVARVPSTQIPRTPNTQLSRTSSTRGLPLTIDISAPTTIISRVKTGITSIRRLRTIPSTSHGTSSRLLIRSAAHWLSPMPVSR